MTSKQVIRTLGLRYLRPAEVEQIEEALNADDAEVMLALVDKLIGQAIRRSQRTKEQR